MFEDQSRQPDGSICLPPAPPTIRSGVAVHKVCRSKVAKKLTKLELFSFIHIKDVEKVIFNINKLRKWEGKIPLYFTQLERTIPGHTTLFSGIISHRKAPHAIKIYVREDNEGNPIVKVKVEVTRGVTAVGEGKKKVFYGRKYLDERTIQSVESLMRRKILKGVPYTEITRGMQGGWIQGDRLGYQTIKSLQEDNRECQKTWKDRKRKRRENL